MGISLRPPGAKPPTPWTGRWAAREQLGCQAVLWPTAWHPGKLIAILRDSYSDPGGEGGIRTHDRVAPITVFETVAFNRARPPLRVWVDARKVAVPTGFEPAFSALTGPRGWPGYPPGPPAHEFCSSAGLFSGATSR